MPEASKGSRGCSISCELYDAEPGLRTAYRQFLSDASLPDWPLELSGSYDGHLMVKLRSQAPDGVWTTHSIVRTTIESTVQALTLFLWREYGAWRKRAEGVGHASQ